MNVTACWVAKSDQLHRKKLMFMHNSVMCMHANTTLECALVSILYICICLFIYTYFVLCRCVFVCKDAFCTGYVAVTRAEQARNS